MNGKVRQFISRLIPPSRHAFNLKNRELAAKIGEMDKQLRKLEGSMQDMTAVTRDMKTLMQERFPEERGKSDKVLLNAKECLWAGIFSSTVNDSAWLKDKSFSPGRWAVGYQYLYVMFRVLDGFHPSSILEMGLGQSTRMIAQYAQEYAASHYIAEHDRDWIDFFENSFGLPASSEISQLDLKETEYLDDDRVLVYDRFKETFGNREYDFISVDGPFGAGAQIYSRIDVLGLIPQCLKKSFVIMIDDYERKGEQAAADLIRTKLSDSGIGYRTGTYVGEKTAYIIVSEDLKFFTSL